MTLEEFALKCGVTFHEKNTISGVDHGFKANAWSCIDYGFPSKKLALEAWFFEEFTQEVGEAISSLLK